MSFSAPKLFDHNNPNEMAKTDEIIKKPRIILVFINRCKLDWGLENKISCSCPSQMPEFEKLLTLIYE
jgi:hypothetical protein